MSVRLSLQRVWTEPFTACLAGCLCLMAAAYLVLIHARAIRTVRDVGIPTMQRIGNFQQRLQLLQEQIQVAEVQSALTNGSLDEALRLFVIPQTADLGRLLGFFDVLRDQLAAEELVQSMSDITIGDPVEAGAAGNNERLVRYPLDVHFTITERGLRTLLLFFDTAGYLTVGDALSESERERLLLLTEQENVAGLPALEQFLGTSLLAYARTPEHARDELLKTFGSQRFIGEFDRVLDRSRLPQVRYLLGGALGAALEEQHLWPLRFLTLDKTTSQQLDSTHFTLSLQLSAYARAPQER